MTKTFLWEVTKRFSITLLAVASAHYCLDKAGPLIQKYARPTTDQRPAIAEPSELERKVQPVVRPMEEYSIRELLEDVVYEP